VNQDVAEWFLGARPLSLQKLQIPATLHVVVLAPHPDDFDAVAATMRYLHRNGNRIDVLIVTSGASGVESGFGGAFTSAAKATLRENEQLTSARLFGLAEDRLVFLRLTEDQDGHPEDMRANYLCVRSCLAARHPNLVFLPHPNDPNEGHRRTYALFRQSVREEKLSLAACLNRDPKTVAMREDLHFEFDSETAAWKGELLRTHQSQQRRNLNHRGHGFDERVLRVNRNVAAASNLPRGYAEAFELEFYSAGDILGGNSPS
jgi:LmbE family N-acetylglucosaminyl deacetylase